MASLAKELREAAAAGSGSSFRFDFVTPRDNFTTTPLDGRAEAAGEWAGPKKKRRKAKKKKGMSAAGLVEGEEESDLLPDVSEKFESISLEASRRSEVGHEVERAPAPAETKRRRKRKKGKGTSVAVGDEKSAPPGFESMKPMYATGGPMVLSFKDPELTEEQRAIRRWGMGINVSAIGPRKRDPHWSEQMLLADGASKQEKAPADSAWRSTVDADVSLSSVGCGHVTPASNSDPASTGGSGSGHIANTGDSPFSFGFRF